MTLQEIASFLGGELNGPGDIEITGPAKIETAQSGQITFLSNPKYRQYLKTTKASAIIIDSRMEDVTIPYIFVQNAYVGFLMMLKMYNPPEHAYIEGISDQAFIDPSARVHPSARIGPLVYIGPLTEVGENTVLYPGVILLKNVKIGADSVLYPNVSVRENCNIGSRVILHNGCVIGSDGFGFAPKGEIYMKIPQLGNVIVEDDVELGANTTIDRATLGATVIRQGCKFDNLVQIAHNVVIGKNTVIAAQSGIAGSVELGEHCTVGGQVGIIGHIRMGNNVTIAAQSGVSKSAPDDSILLGSPAMPIAREKRIEASLRHLPEIIKTISELDKEVRLLKEKLDKLNQRGFDAEKTTNY